ncbi:MAG: NADH dehydrogenase [Desulfuromonas sp. SDB]|nr:MAG: NADH dehydrogenase [Desulfuromonas sp. SDB]
MKKVKVGMATCGISAGAEQIYKILQDSIQKNDIEVELVETGCMGRCFQEVLVEVEDKNQNYLYGNVTPEKINQIIHQHLIDNKPVNQYLALDLNNQSEDQFFQKQKRIVLRNCGIIDPTSIEDYISRGGYQALKKVLKELTPEQVIQEIDSSGLRGRGGGGFPTGMKWSFARKAEGIKKYIICNADEGDPGAFMDRSVLEGDPHSVIEGMIIAGYAIGACLGYIYVRAEYPQAIQKLKTAIEQCHRQNYLGENILNSNFSFDLIIKEGAGAFVCGEETALISSIEGKRGVPRIRPPFPAVKGLWGCPTSINNVETFANISWIILNRADKFSQLGTAKSKGTKVFALAGKIKRSGLVEVPMGITINEIVYEVGGGIINNRQFKAVQMGGPSGGCIPASMGDLKIDYDEITSTGAIMGSGGMIVLDDSNCMVDVAKFFLSFTQNESCGKCTFCRIGTKRMLEILEKICLGQGELEHLDILEDLSYQIKKTSLCGLGQTAPNPVLTTLKYFRDEYLAHIQDHRCPAGVCSALLTYQVNPDLCKGCTLCVKKCPVNAIQGEKGETAYIDQNKCIKCGQCFDVCKFKAIIKN